MAYYKLPPELHKGITEYLATRPLAEVLDGYVALRNLEFVEDTDKVELPTDVE